MTKETDKGGPVVIMTKSYYYEMVMGHLQDTGTLMEADVENPDKRVLEIVKEHADENTPNIVTANENEYISDFVPSSSKFYCLPKFIKIKKLKE